MKTALDEAILAVGGSLALSTLAKATFATILGLCAAALTGRKHAAFRHALLAGMFGVLLALPLVSAVSPPVRIVVRLAQARNLRTLRARPGGAASPIVIARPGVPATPQPPGWTVSDLLAVCWIAGRCCFCCRSAWGCARFAGCGGRDCRGSTDSRWWMGWRSTRAFGGTSMCCCTRR